MKYGIISVLLTGMLSFGVLPETDVMQTQNMKMISVLGQQVEEDTVLLCGGVSEYLKTRVPVEQQTVPEAEENEKESEYADLALADVRNYVNVRSEANTQSKIVGKIYDGAVAQILETVDGEEGQWFQIVSGNVEGFIKSEFFLYGDAAAEVIDEYVTR